MANSAYPEQLASEEANWSGSTLFAKAGYIRVQQDKGYNVITQCPDWIAQMLRLHWALHYYRNELQ